VAVAKKPVLKDIVFTLPKDKPAYKVVSVLQEQFKSPETRKADGTVVAPRKAQGRLLIDAVVEAVFQYASAETLAALADEVKGKGEGDKKGKASEYIAAIVGARAVAPSTPKPVTALTDEELEAEVARRKAAREAGAKTKNVAAV
jgi:hypothetical protein